MRDSSGNSFLTVRPGLRVRVVAASTDKQQSSWYQVKVRAYMSSSRSYSCLA